MTSFSFLLLSLILLLLLGALNAQMPSSCLNRRCRTNPCQNSEYQDQQCSNGTRKCCDRVCPLGAAVTSCGSSLGCFSITTQPITVGAPYRTASCSARVVESSTPCTSATCRDCVESMGSWSACSLSCSTLGSQSRSRVVSVAPLGRGRACTLPVSELRACSPAPPPCPIPCAVSAWSAWSACNAPCAPAQKQRVRNLEPPQFGAPPCPHASELVDCTELAPCEGTTFERTPFPTPVLITPPPDATATTAASDATPPPPTADDPTASIFVRAGDIAEIVFADPTKRSVVSLPEMLGQLRAAAYGPVAGELAFSLSGSSIGCQVFGAPIAGVSPGELIEPLSLQFDFVERRSFVRIALSGFEEGERGLLIGRSGTANRTIELTTPDNSFELDTTGYAQWELRAANGTFGLLVFSVLRAVAGPPTPAPLPVTDAIDATDTAPTSELDSAAVSEEPAVAPVAADDSTLVIALSIVGAVLLLAAVVIVIVARRRRSRARRESISTPPFRAPVPAAQIDRVISHYDVSPGGSVATDYQALNLSSRNIDTPQTPYPPHQVGTSYSNFHQQDDLRQYSDVPYLGPM